MFRKTVLASTLLLSGIVVSLWMADSHAQDVEPRAMTAAPVGTNFFGVRVAYSWGAVLLDKTLPAEDVDGYTANLTPTYSRFVNVFGLTGRVDAVLPLAAGEWDAFVGGADTETTVTRNGLGDPILGFALFAAGARAMTPAEFQKYRKKTIVGFNVRVSMPLGQYDSSKLVNLGSNRWRIIPGVAVSHRRGSWTFEAYTGVWFFADNKEFLGDNVLSQDPMLAFQVHVGYNFKRGMWVTLGTRQTTAGETSLNGESNDDPANTNRVGLVFATPVVGRHSLKLIATTGTWESKGTDFNTLGAQWVVGF